MTKKTLTPKNPNNKYIRAYNKAAQTGLSAPHVVSRGSEWIVKRIASKTASAVLPNKKEAVAKAKEFASGQGTYYVVHSKNGEIKKVTPRKK